MLLNCERQKTVAVCLCERLSNTKDGKSKFSLVCSDDGGFYCRGGTKKKKHDFGPVLFCFGFCHSSAVIVRLIRHSLAAATEEGAQSVASVFVLLFKISAGAHHLLLFGWQKT